LYVEWQPYEIELLREKNVFLLLSKQSSLHECQNKGRGIWFACASDGSWYSCRSAKSKKYIHNFPDKIIVRWYLVNKKIECIAEE
jgi:hypothetical protein